MARPKRDIAAIDDNVARIEKEFICNTVKSCRQRNESWKRAMSWPPENRDRLLENMQVSINLSLDYYRASIITWKTARNSLLRTAAYRKMIRSNATKSSAAFSLPCDFLQCRCVECRPFRVCVILPRDFLAVENMRRISLLHEKLVYPPHTQPAPGPPDKLSRRAQRAQRQQEARNESRRQRRPQRRPQRAAMRSMYN